MCMDMVQFFWSRSASLWIAILYILLGALLLLFPGVTGTVFVWALAAGAAVYGLSHLWRYLQSRKGEVPAAADLFLSVLALVFALFALLRPVAILSFLPFVLGGLLLLDGVGKIPLAVQVLRMQSSMTAPVCISVLIPLAVGLLLFLYPFSAVKMTIMLFGAALVLDGISDASSAIMAKRMDKNHL